MPEALLERSGRRAEKQFRGTLMRATAILDVEREARLGERVSPGHIQISEGSHRKSTR
jgi:hypothetical protein